MQARLDAILKRLKQEHAPEIRLKQSGLSAVANMLAERGVLVISLELAQDTNARSAVEQLASAYADLYQSWAEALFPSFMEFRAAYGDHEQPPVVVLHGSCEPLMKALACCIGPYLQVRQRTARPTQAELRGVVAVLLDDLEVGDIGRARYDALLRRSMGILEQLLGLPLRQTILNDHDAAFFERLQLPAPPPLTLPVEAPAPTPAPPAPANPAPPLAIPIFFERKPAGEKGRPRPPVPPPPGYKPD